MAQKFITNYFKKVYAEDDMQKQNTLVEKDSTSHLESDVKQWDSDSKKNADKSLAVQNLFSSPNVLENKVSKIDKRAGNTILKAQSGRNVGAEYNPSKCDYHPIRDAFWHKDEPTPYLALTRTFQIVEEIRGRLKMIEILSNFLRSVILLNPNDLLPCIYLSLNQLSPAYEGLELGVAELTVIRAICKSTGQSLSYVKGQLDSIGDLGIVAEQARSSQCLMYQPAALTIAGVFEKLKDIAKLSGQSSVNRKIEKIQCLFVSCRYSEARFLIRSLLGKLRIGLAEQSLMQALAMAITDTEMNLLEPTISWTSKTLSESKMKTAVEENALLLKTTYCQCPNYDKMIPLLLKHGIANLIIRCPMQPGTPIKPMLALPTNGVNEVFTRFEGLSFTCEWKYDGERAQIHCNENGIISIYSRNQENNTAKYPDIISRIADVKQNNVTTFIIDSEVVAWDTQTKQILPFQVLSTRKRKNVEINNITVQVCVYMFDLLYLNGESLITKNFLERRQLLKDNFKEFEGRWHFATSCDTNDLNEVQTFLEESIKGNCEGLMIKTLEKNANYEIAKRSRNWLKLKKDYLLGIGDSLDLVVIGGYKGKGKRAGVYGAFLLACYESINEEYQCICKIGTGFSDDDLNSHSEILKAHIITNPKSYYQFDSSFVIDSWFEPVQVWEVKCADLSLSPVHKAGIGIVDSEKGISLRFPRFIRIRQDKSPEDATTTQQVVDMYFSQDQIKNQQKDFIPNEFDTDIY